MASNLNSFISLLNKDLQTLSDLEVLLDQERTSLENNELSELNELTEKKTPLLIHLEQNSVAKSAWLKECKLPLPRILELLSVKAPTAMKLYQQCQDKLKQIHRLNEVNGRIIATSHQRVERLMCIIRGQGKQMRIYGQNGTERSVNSNHYLAQA